MNSYRNWILLLLFAFFFLGVLRGVSLMEDSGPFLLSEVVTPWVVDSRKLLVFLLFLVPFSISAIGVFEEVWYFGSTYNYGFPSLDGFSKILSSTSLPMGESEPFFPLPLLGVKPAFFEFFSLFLSMQRKALICMSFSISSNLSRI